MGRLPDNFAPIDTGVFFDTKVRAVSPAAKLIYLASLLDSNRQMTDGRLRRSDLTLLASQTGVKPAAHRELLSTGLWLETADGFEIAGFLEHNKSRTERETSKSAARERKERLENKRRNGVLNGVPFGVQNARKSKREEKEEEAEQAAYAGSAS